MMSKKLEVERLERKMATRRKATAAFVARQRAAGFIERKLLVTDVELASIKSHLAHLRDDKKDGEPDANLQMVLDGNASGDSLAEAAEQSRNLLEHVRNTSTNIRDLMESLHQDITTAQYVQRFFSDYIESVFIGDYRELRTREHPLSKRGQILAKIESIHESEAQRKRLIAWYESKRTSGDAKKAERLFERDIHRLSELQRIDE